MWLDAGLDVLRTLLQSLSARTNEHQDCGSKIRGTQAEINIIVHRGFYLTYKFSNFMRAVLKQKRNISVA
jgi:hypothetical protein